MVSIPKAIDQCWSVGHYKNLFIYHQILKDTILWNDWIFSFTLLVPGGSKMFLIKSIVSVGSQTTDSNTNPQSWIQIIFLSWKVYISDFPYVVRWNEVLSAPWGRHGLRTLWECYEHWICYESLKIWQVDLFYLRSSVFVILWFLSTVCSC